MVLGRLCSIVERVCASMSDHMHREEAELFPLLERSLCAAAGVHLLDWSGQLTSPLDTQSILCLHSCPDMWLFP